MPTTADDADALHDAAADAANPPGEENAQGADPATDRVAPSSAQDDEACSLNLDHPAVKAAIERATQALLNKRTELLAEVKEERAARREAQSQLQALAARVDALESERADLSGRLADEQAARESAVAKVKEDLRKAQADGDEAARLAALDALERATAEGQERVAAIERAARERTERASRQVSALIAENAVLTALHAVDVKADLFGAAQALIGRRVTVEDAADGMRAVVDGKPVADFVREWSETPEGRNFIRARLSAGGGGAGRSPSRGAKARGAFADNPWARTTWNLTRQGQILRTDAGLAAQLRRAAGAA